MPPEIQIFLLAMMPLGELRVAIPLGLTIYQLSPVVVYFFAVLGNIFVVLLLLTFLGVFCRWASHNIYFFNRFFTWLFSRTRKTYYNRISKYGFYFLPLFVAIPLPVTGGWTAALITFVFRIPFKKAFSLISLGIGISGLIVLFLSQAGIALEKHFGWQVLIGLVLIVGIIYLFYKKGH